MNHTCLGFLSDSSSDVTAAHAFLREQEDDGVVRSVDADHPAFYGTRTARGTYRTPLPCLVDRGELTEEELYEQVQELRQDELIDWLVEQNPSLAMKLTPAEPDDCHSARAESIDANEADEADLNLRRGGSWYAVPRVRQNLQLEGNKYVGRALYFRRQPDRLIEVVESRPMQMF